MLKKIGVIFGALALAILPSIMRSHAQTGSNTQNQNGNTSTAITQTNNQDNDTETADDNGTAVDAPSTDEQKDADTQDVLEANDKETDDDSIQAANDKEKNDSAVETEKDTQDGHDDGQNDD
jgi:hypothetical protein